MLTMEPGGEGIVLVKGRLDAAQAASAQAYLDKLQGTVTLDLAGLDYISSAGLGVLLKTQKRLTGSGGKVRLTAVSAHLHDIFVYSGFDQLFEIESSK
jgi:anti-anti-sigma factor